MKRWLGMDLIDLAIHVFVTICIGVVAVEAGATGPDEEIVLAGIFATSAIVFGIRRHFGLRKLQNEPLPGEVAAERIADLEIRVAELELAQDRLALLEERVDFSERLLVQERSAALPGKPSARDA
jgi:hypothetical protein